jgi:hypothetical protein
VRLLKEQLEMPLLTFFVDFDKLQPSFCHDKGHDVVPRNFLPHPRLKVLINLPIQVILQQGVDCSGLMTAAQRCRNESIVAAHPHCDRVQRRRAWWSRAPHIQDVIRRWPI